MPYVRWGIIAVAKLLYSDWWKSACSDSSGKRKELYVLAPFKDQPESEV